MIVVAIPMRDHCDDTMQVLAQVLAEDCVDHVLIWDNDSEDRCCLDWLAEVEATDDRITVRVHHGKTSFYTMWNQSIDLTVLAAAPDEPAYVAILNNDIDLAPDTIGILALHLWWERMHDSPVWITYPDWTRDPTKGSSPGRLVETEGTRNSGGMCGYAFMLDARARTEIGLPPIDERYELLCGDGDLIEELQARGGRAGRVTGLPLGHRESTTQHDDRNRAWTKKARQRDRMRRDAKWGQGRPE